MLNKIRDMFAPSRAAMKPVLPSGERVYAVGDIHGRADLFDQLIRLIQEDDGARRSAHTTIILLGDLVDRGPDSAGVIRRARALAQRRDVEILMGNHEEMFLDARTNTDVLRGFLKFGGLETILSYGVPAEAAHGADLQGLQALMNAAVPEDDFEFLESFKKLVRKGDYIFVHAGVRPGTPLEMQISKDCRWIREPFLSHKGDYGGFVIHGHTITEEPEIRANRIGIDTGAFVHGTLTAIGLEGSEQWFLHARDHEAATEASVAA